MNPRKIVAIFGVTLLCAVVAPGVRGENAQAAETPKAVAKVNGVVITETQFEQAIDTFVPPGAFHGAAGSKRDQYRKTALDMLIERELIYQEAKKRGVKADDADVDRSLDEIRKKFKTKAAFDKALKESGMTQKEYRKLLAKNETISLLLRTEVDDKAKYSDKALEEYYAENKDKFVRPEAFKVLHMLFRVAPLASEQDKVAAKEKAEAILKRVKAGEDFGALAHENSDDDYRIKGGDLGWLHRGRLETALDEAVGKLEVGDVTMVETIYGYHILKLDGRKPPEQLSYDEVKDSVRKQLESKKSQELKEAFISSLKAKAKIEIY